MPRSAAFFVLLLTLLASSLLTARERSPASRQKLSVSARLALRLWQLQRPLPVPGREAIPDAHLARVALQFVEPPSDTRLRELATLGIEFWASNGHPLRRGRLVPARVPFELLEVVEFWSDIERVELRLRPPQPELVENAPAMVETPPTWATFDTLGLPMRGKGVTVGVIDSWVDLFHPWFFKPDGARLNWLDGNDDGLFDPGEDGIDWNGDGLLTTNEIAHLQKGIVEWNEGMGPQFENNVTWYYPPLDWLWLDTSGTGKREYGQAFKESTPAFGDPIFVADDVNGNGFLDLGEKVVGLRTSKFKKIIFPGSGKTFERGDNLLQYPVPALGSSHATMTLAVLAGGAAPYQMHAGVAPDADIILADTDQGMAGYPEGEYGDAYLAAAIMLVDAGANVLMHEYGSPLLEFGDGSSILETGIDALAETDGVLSCTAAHNFAGYNMHAEALVPSGGSVTFPIATNIYGEDYPTSYLYMTIRYRGADNDLALTLKGAEGWEESFGPEGSESQGEKFNAWYSGVEVSPRQTHMMSLVLYPAMAVAELPGDEWQLVVQNVDGEDLLVDLFVADQTGYLYTGIITEHATKAGTMAHPSTADSVLTVGAYRANVDSWYGEVEIGDLSFYSGQGPRIDGERGLDIVGPSDMLGGWWSEGMLFYPGLRYASGTSGSLPQATGVVALLLQAEPDLLPAEVKQRVIDGAIRDDFTGPDATPVWGAGKLSAYRTLYGNPPPDNAPPVASVIGPAQVRLEEPFLLDATGSTDDGPVEELQVRWDLNYDGAFDLGYRSELTLPVEAIYDPGPFVALAEVRDGQGGTDRTLVRIVVLDELYQPPQPEPELEELRSEDLTADADVSPPPIANSRGCNGTAVDTSGVSWALLASLLLLLAGLRRRSSHRAHPIL